MPSLIPKDRDYARRTIVQHLSGTFTDDEDAGGDLYRDGLVHAFLLNFGTDGHGETYDGTGERMRDEAKALADKRRTAVPA